jgi:hypothetical protein
MVGQVCVWPCSVSGGSTASEPVMLPRVMDSPVARSQRSLSIQFSKGCVSPGCSVGETVRGDLAEEGFLLCRVLGDGQMLPEGRDEHAQDAGDLGVVGGVVVGPWQPLGLFAVEQVTQARRARGIGIRVAGRPVDDFSRVLVEDLTGGTPRPAQGQVDQPRRRCLVHNRE